MKYIQSTISLLALHLFVLITPIESQTNWYILQSALFRFYYTETDKKFANELPTLLATEYAKLTSQIGIELVESVRIFLSPSEEVFNELTGHIIPDWGEGVADVSQNLIILKSPNLSGNLVRFRKVVRHELIHILIGQSYAPSQNIPKWFSEGIAIYFSYDEEFSSGKAISKALISDSIVPLDEIDDLLNFPTEKARLAYEESYSVILYLEHQFGFDAIVQIIQAIKNGHAFEPTLDDVCGMDLYDIELAWYQFIEKKYRWRFLLDFETFLWIFILLLFILVFVAIRMRNRKVMKRWDDEERLTD
ncbi:MAG: peptidase MA family metallohydrolase [bacterium]